MHFEQPSFSSSWGFRQFLLCKASMCRRSQVPVKEFVRYPATANEACFVFSD